MDIEEVKQFLGTDEGKVLIEESEATKGLRLKRDDLLSRNVQLQSQLKAYSELGDLETLSSIINEYKKSKENKDDANKTTVDSKTVAELEHLRKELENERGIRTKREQAMVNSYVDAEITGAIAKFKGVPELLKHVVQGRVKGELKDDGSIGFSVLNADGSPMFKNGKEASVDDLLSEIKANPVFGRAFDADNVQGSGTRQTNGKVTSGKDMTLTERMAQQARKR